MDEVQECCMFCNAQHSAAKEPNFYEIQFRKGVEEREGQLGLRNRTLINISHSTFYKDLMYSEFSGNVNIV